MSVSFPILGDFWLLLPQYFLGLSLSSSSCFSKMRFLYEISYRTYFSAGLFGLSFCVCSLCSARLKFFFFLVSGPWSWRSWVMQSYWWEGLVPAYWCMEQDLVPLVRDMPRGISRGDHGLRMTLGCLSVDGCGCVPILLVVWLEGSQC